MRKNDEMPFKQWYLRDKQSPFLYLSSTYKCNFLGADNKQ